MSNLEKRFVVDSGSPLYEITLNDNSGEGGGVESAVFQVSAVNFISAPINLDAAIQSFAQNLAALSPAYTLGSIKKSASLETTL